MERDPQPIGASVRPRYPWLKLAILYAAIVAGQLMVIPVGIKAGPRVSPQDLRIALLVALILFATVPLSVAAIPGLGLPGTPLLDRLLRREALGGTMAKSAVRAAILTGISFAVAIPILALRSHMPGLRGGRGNGLSPAFTPGVLGLAMLSGLGAGIQEEILFRLGLLTVLVWVLARAARIRGPVTSRTAILWIANLAQAYVFGLMHQALGLTGSIGKFSALGAAIDPRTAIALVFGYGAIRYGVETAAIAHILFDESIFLVVAIIPILPG
jgi:hypothetical protein